MDLPAPRRPSWSPSGVVVVICSGLLAEFSACELTHMASLRCQQSDVLCLLRLRRPSWSLAGVVVVICSGLLLLVAGETQFDLVGFLVVMGASMLAGFRWTITQVLLQGDAKHGGGAAPKTTLHAILGVGSRSKPLVALAACSAPQPVSSGRLCTSDPTCGAHACRSCVGCTRDITAKLNRH